MEKYIKKLTVSSHFFCWSLSRLSRLSHFHYKLSSFLPLLSSHCGNELQLISFQKSKVSVWSYDFSPQSEPLCFLTFEVGRGQHDSLRGRCLLTLGIFCSPLTHRPDSLPRFLPHRFELFKVLTIVSNKEVLRVYLILLYACALVSIYLFLS